MRLNKGISRMLKSLLSSGGRWGMTKESRWCPAVLVLVSQVAVITLLSGGVLACPQIQDGPITESRTNKNQVALRDPLDDDDDDDYFRPVGLSNRLTVSFPPDGTSIFTHQSSLYESFADILTEAELQQSILRAFHMWAREGNLDVGIVPDSGDAFGIAGRSIGDERFGDVRIGAYPMASDVYAIALRQEDFISGTWSGDILFNSNAEFLDADQFFTVALHEAGHALGLGHSDNPMSVMHPFSTNSILSRADVTNFRVLYGVRRLDSYDSDDYDNDTFDSATELEFDDDFGDRGEYPSIVFGDIANARDVDYFELEIRDEYSGPISFTVVSGGISLLAPRITVLDEFGQFAGSDVSTSTRGDRLTVSIDSSQFDEKVYVRIEGATASQAGSYALVTKLDNRVIVLDEEIARVVLSSEFTFMEQEDIADYLADPNGYLFNDDAHSDDDHKSAFQLETEDGYALRTRFRRSASLLDATDVDVYEIQSPDFEPSTEFVTMIISLRSVETGGMIPKASVFVDELTEVSSSVLVNGLGEYVIQVDTLQPESTYFIHVQSDDFLAFENGNYEMTITYSDRQIAFAEFATGTIGAGGMDADPIESAVDVSGLTSRDRRKYHSLHVAESQMFQFAFEADELAQNDDALLWVTIYDENGGAIYQAATRDGERRTANAAYFSPGSYTIEVVVASRTGGLSSAQGGIGYRLLGLDIGDPQGPEFNDPTNSPFDQNGIGEYVYPDDVVSSATFIFVDGVASNLPTSPRDDPPEDLYLWYWYGI